MGPDNNYRFDVTLLAADGASVSHSVCVWTSGIYVRLDDSLLIAS